MSKMEWLIEVSETFLDGNDLADAVEKRGGKVHRMKDMRLPYPVWPRLDGYPLAFGSCNFITRVCRQPQLSEGVFDFHSQLRCSHYYHHIYDMFRGWRCFMPQGAIKHAKMGIERMFGQQVFIRPDSATKQFDGHVFDVCKLDEADTDPHLSRASGDLVVLANVCSFQQEYRVFCRNGKAVCHSSYIPLDSEWIPAPPDVVAFAEKAAERLKEAVGTMVVVDVGTHVMGDPLSLIEINGVNSSGFYGCDLEAYIGAMEAEFIERRN